MAWESCDPKFYEQMRSGHMAKRRIALINHAMSRTSGNVLDFGCGTGTDIFHFAKDYSQRIFYGIDPDKKFIEFAKKNYRQNNLKYINDNMLPSKIKFGFIYSIDVLHHVEDMQQTINHVCNSLEKKGRWLVIEPNILNPKVFLNQFFGKDEKLFFKKKTEKMFRKAGLNILKKGLFLLIPYQIKNPPKILIVLERLFENIIGGSIYYILEKGTNN